MADNETAQDPLDALAAGVNAIWQAEPAIALSCARTFLAICQHHKAGGSGVPVLELAESLATPRTNVTRHLKFLRKIGWVETIKDTVDRRVDLNAPTTRGVDIYRSLAD